MKILLMEGIMMTAMMIDEIMIDMKSVASTIEGILEEFYKILVVSWHIWYMMTKYDTPKIYIGYLVRWADNLFTHHFLNVSLNLKKICGSLKILALNSSYAIAIVLIFAVMVSDSKLRMNIN